MRVSCALLALALVLDGWTAVALPLESAKDEDKDLAAGSQLSIVGEPKSVELLSGSSLELSCEAFGTPVPTIQWLKDGKLVRLDAPAPMSFQQPKKPTILTSPVMAERISNYGIRTFQMSTTSSKLHLPCVGKDNVGLYTCVANNGRETVTANATVGLVEKSNSLWSGNDCQRKRGGDTTGSGSAAQIYMWTDSRMERPGVSVQLMCRATGSPMPQISWYETADSETDNRLRPISNDDPRFTLLSNGDLLVKQTPADVPLSIFKCEAVNKHGSDSIMSMLLEIIDDTDEDGQVGQSLETPQGNSLEKYQAPDVELPM